MANQCIFPRSSYSLDEKTDSQGNGNPDHLFSSSLDSSSSPLSSYSSNHYNESCGSHDYPSASPSHNTPSFLQRIKLNPRYNRPSSLLELRYGQFQSGIVGKGAYAMVRLVKSKNNHHHHHHSNNLKRIHADSDSTPTATTFAVKIFKKVKRTENHGKYMKRIISEYCIASSMNHPNIIKTLDLVTDVSNRYCIVMEYVSSHLSALMTIQFKLSVLPPILVVLWRGSLSCHQKEQSDLNQDKVLLQAVTSGTRLFAFFRCRS